MEKSNVLNCKTLTVEIIGFSERKTSKCFTNKYGLPNKKSILNKSLELFNELLEREKKVRMIRIKVSGLIRENENEKKKGLISLLDNLKNDYKDGILPSKKKFLTSSKEKSNYILNENKERYNSKTKIKDKNENKKRSKTSVNKIRDREKKLLKFLSNSETDNME